MLDYYETLFSTEIGNVEPLSTHNGFPNLDPSMIDDLGKNLSNEEIKAAAYDLGEFKAPGPDGIQVFSYHEYWGIIGDSVCAMVKNFFDEPHRINTLNKTNIVLIPKGDKPETVKDFRPISLCNVSYKIITKVI